MDDVQEVTPEVIDAPEVISGADRWLAEQRAKVAGLAEEYRPHEIKDAADYKQSKRERAEARKAIKAVEDDRRRQVGAIKDAVRDFESQVRDLLAPLSGVDEGYKAELTAWEGLVVANRTDEVRAWYEETQGDVAQLVPFDVLWRRFAADGKWDKYSTNLVAEEQDVAARVEGIERDLDTIRGYGFDQQDEENLRAAYLRTLDLSGAVREAEEARKQRERMAEVERQRAERMAEAQKAAPAPVQNVPLPMDDASVRHDETQASAAPAAPTGGTVTYMVTVPREHVRDFVEAMRALGWAHGRRIHDKQAIG